MPDVPPRLAERFLAWALGDDDGARSVLGDVNEEFVDRLESDGRRRARMWYRIEALALGVSAWMSRATGRPIARATATREGTMRGSIDRLGFLHDARYALRAVRKDVGYFVFATAIIGLGVGASTAVYSVMSPLLLEPLPFHAPDRLAWIALSDAEGYGLSGVTSRTANVRDFRELSRSFEAIGGYNAFFEQASYNLVGRGDPERLVGVDVTQNFLDVLGVQPALGRNFVAEEGVWGGRPAIVLAHGFWQRRFAADPGVVGASLTINDVPTEVVGVLPAAFDFSSVFAPTTDVDFLRPWAISDETDAWGNTTSMVGRLVPGATVASAQAELESIAASLAEADPQRWGLGAAVSGLHQRIAQPFRTRMLVLVAAAALVMAIVCVNLSSMLLARGPRRTREMAVRRTLGATRGRLVRQLLLESAIVALSGAAVGAGVAWLATGFVTRTRGLEIPMLSSASVDAGALGFTVAIALLAGFAAGMLPALQVAERGVGEALSSAGRGASSGTRSRHLREGLVVAEIALACVLLVFGGLLLRSFQEVMDVELGFRADHRVAWRLGTSRPFETLTEAVAFYDEIVEAVEAVPGVDGVGIVDALPLGRQRSWGTRVVGVEYTEQTELEQSFFPHIVDPRYLDVMSIPLLEGRRFTRDDDRGSARVAIVNETAARRMFPDGRAIGRFLAIGPDAGTEIVGVVGDVRHVALDAGFGNEIYFPMAQMWDFDTPDLVVRTPRAVDDIAGPVRAALASVDPQIPTEDFRTLESIVQVAVSPRRFTLQLLGAFALSALLLAGLGIYGVLSYSVTERLPEIGIRMALGESAASVRRGMVARTAGLALAGIVLGTAGALAGTRLIGSMLYGVEPTDPVAFVSMIAVLLGVALLSGLVPAIRASRTDSAQALRSAP